MAKVLFIIAKKGFRDVEYFIPREILEKAGYTITVASNSKAGETAIGADDGEVKIDLNYTKAKIDDFDAVIFIGGPGALENLDNAESYRLIQETVAKDKILGAICIAPAILAKVGVLKNKKATVWSSTFNKSGIEVLKNNSADYIGENVIQDGKIITANGPLVAKEFGEKLLSVLR